MLCIFLKIDGNRVYVDFTCMFTAIHPLFGKDIRMSLHEVERLLVKDNGRLHGFCCHLGCGAVAAKITANVWKILQLSTLAPPQLHVGFERKMCL